MKTILITGGAGFIGSNLCERLLMEGNNIICVDNLYTGSIKNIEHLIGNANFKFINHDIINPLDINEEIDQIYNFACPASPPKYQQDPIYTLQINFQGMLNMLELSKTKKATILQSSTSEIYGEPQISPQPESYRGNVNTIGIRSCYDEGKRVAETLMMDYHNKFNVDIRIARIFNTYGPRMDKYDGRVITNFINQSLNNEKIKYNTLHFLTNKEAEMVKMFRNCYLATKVSFCNEMYEYCHKLDVNYENVRKIAASDDRILHSHTLVPGHDGRKGFGGTCFPKDTSSLKYEMTKIGVKPYIMEAIIDRNETIDRPEKDWVLDKGRAVVDI